MSSSISEYIKTSRLELGLTQDELAQRAGISVRYLRDIENGHGMPSDWMYENLLQALSNHEQNRAHSFARRAALTVSNRSGSRFNSA